MREQQAGIVRSFRQQGVDGVIECGFLGGRQLAEAAQQHGKAGAQVVARDHCQVRYRLRRMTLADQQRRQCVVGLRTVGVQFDPEAHRLIGLGFALHELGEVCGVCADRGIPQQPGLFQVGGQRGVVVAAAQGKLGQQPRPERRAPVAPGPRQRPRPAPGPWPAQQVGWTRSPPAPAGAHLSARVGAWSGQVSISGVRQQ